LGRWSIGISADDHRHTIPYHGREPGAWGWLHGEATGQKHRQEAARRRRRPGGVFWHRRHPGTRQIAVLCVCFSFLGPVAYMALAILMPSPARDSPRIATHFKRAQTTRTAAGVNCWAIAAVQLEPEATMSRLPEQCQLFPKGPSGGSGVLGQRPTMPQRPG